MILLIYPNNIPLFSPSLSFMFIIEKIIRVYLGKGWGKIRKLLIFRNKLKFESDFILGEKAKIATVILQMNNFDTRNFDGAKPYIINKNGTNLATPLS